VDLSYSSSPEVVAEPEPPSPRRFDDPARDPSNSS